MAITFRGSATGAVTAGGVLSITLSSISGLAANDVVVVCGVSSAGTAATPSGWTEIYAPGSMRDVAFYKVMPASPDSSVTLWDVGSTGDTGCAVALAFTGVDTANVLDVSVPTRYADGSAGSSPNPPSITPANNNCAIVIFGGEVKNAGSVDTTPGTVTSYSTVNTNASDTNNTSISGGYQILSGGAGSPQDPGAWSTWGITGFIGGNSVAMTIALRALVAGGTHRMFMVF